MKVLNSIEYQNSSVAKYLAMTEKHHGHEAQQDMCSSGLLEVCCLVGEFTDLSGSLVLDHS